MTLRYASAASTTYSEPVPLTSDTALPITVTPEMSDMPHEKTSRWSFLVLPASAGQAIVGTFHVTVDIVKMRDIENFPGHPQLFNGANTLTLFDGVGTSSQGSFITQAAGFLTRAEQEPDGVPSDKVVPMETLSMTANLTITSATSNIGEVTDIWFLYKSADARFGRFERANVVTSDPATGVYQFAWPVTMEQTDSPYAKTSQWRFDVRVGTQTTGVGGPCDRCADAEVEYSVVIVAYDALLAEAGEAPSDDNN
jgi:hypothetical protein